MRILKWTGVVAALVLIGSCFLPWATIPGRGITVTGFETTGTDFGKPGVFHTVVSILYIGLMLLNRTWSLRVAFFLSAFNIAWAIRNLILIPACHGGVCPEKHPALYVSLIASILTLISFFFVEVKSRNETAQEPENTAV
jgi:hypothetical protein